MLKWLRSLISSDKEAQSAAEAPSISETPTAPALAFKTTTSEAPPARKAPTPKTKFINISRPQVQLDENGQPIARGYNESRRIDRTVHELLGLLKGILADGEVTGPEIEALGAWILRNAEFADVWPVNNIVESVAPLFDRGSVNEQEREDLRVLFERITGDPATVSLTENPVTTLPLTNPAPHVDFRGKHFVFTGKFLYGSRKACEAAVMERGGTCQPDIRLDTDYVVIGGAGSADWVHSSFGRKIEKAVEYTKRCNLKIISEEHWVRFIDPNLTMTARSGR